MDTQLRKTGLPFLGDVPWGTHICQFYKTSEDLVEMLGPYFQAGLENNEFCMWITSNSLSVKEARRAIRRPIPQFDKYEERGQFQIVPCGEWFLKDGNFELKLAAERWIEKLDQALTLGYDGMRATGDVTGNIASIEKVDWGDFAEYERVLDRTIEHFKMIILCTYALDKCRAAGLVDVLRSHQVALMKTDGVWERLEMNGVSNEPLSMLSPRESEVLELVARGYTNREIGDRLKISVKSVEVYRARAMEKLNLRSRADLVRFALEAGVLLLGRKHQETE